MYKLAIFDFDGTLADSLSFCMSVMNVLADKYKFKRINTEEIDTLRELDAATILKAHGVHAFKIPLIAADLRRLQAENIHEICLFPGVCEILEALMASGIMVSMVTSNSRDNVRSLLPEELFNKLLHPQFGIALFGKQTKLCRILNKTGVLPAAAIYIGDEIRDKQAADAAGMHFGAVGWGYTKPAALLASAPHKFFQTVDQIKEALVSLLSS